MKLEIKKIEPLLPPVGNEQWIEGSVSTKIGKVGKIKTKLDWKDTLGGFKVRWGMNRMNYRIEPGIYAAGNPSPDSPVLVSANYKLTFDILRKNLSGIDAWVLILDTKGVNVWCAAGKGTFGTKELVNRIKKVHLEKIVSHNTLILPQLGAVGVSAFETAKKSGFKVVYGPVRADDLSEYLKNGLQKTEKMSRVFFHLKDRLAVVPIELVGTKKIFIILSALCVLFELISTQVFGAAFWKDYALFMGGILSGAVLTPILLPLIPFRSFALKGFLMGTIWVSFFTYFFLPHLPLPFAADFLLTASVSSYLAVNFTGATTFTSLSGVKKELKIGLPLMLGGFGIGIILKLLIRLLVLS